MNVYVVSVENDHELYLSDAYFSRAAAEEQLAQVRKEFTERYGADSLDEFETDGDIVAVDDGPRAQLHTIAASTALAG